MIIIKRAISSRARSASPCVTASSSVWRACSEASSARTDFASVGRESGALISRLNHITALSSPRRSLLSRCVAQLERSSRRVDADGRTRLQFKSANSAERCEALSQITPSLSAERACSSLSSPSFSQSCDYGTSSCTRIVNEPLRLRSRPGLTLRPRQATRIRRGEADIIHENGPQDTCDVAWAMSLRIALLLSGGLGPRRCF
jgi:hypothetical protein